MVDKGNWVKIAIESITFETEKIELPNLDLDFTKQLPFPFVPNRRYGRDEIVNHTFVKQ